MRIGGILSPLIAFQICSAPVVWGDERGPKQFFERNFSANIIESEPATRERLSPRNDAPRPSPKAKQDVSPAPLAEKEEVSEQPGLKITAIGALLNTSPNEAFVSELAGLVEIALKHDISLGKIYLYGPPLSLSTEEMSSLLTKVWILDGELQNSAALPKQYSRISLSPAYLIRTDAGEYILEGVGPLEKFVTNQGRFFPDNLSHAEEEKLLEGESF